MKEWTCSDPLDRDRSRDADRVAEILQQRHAERAPALEKELAQLAAEQQPCRQESKRVLQAIGGGEASSDMATKRLAEQAVDQIGQDMLLVRERFPILHLLLESVGYDGSTGELELAFYPLGITSLAAEAALIGQPAEVAA